MRFALRFVAAAFLVLPCISQMLDPSANPPKPLRERLLDRASKGDVSAQYDLGKDYEGGRIGLPRDLVEAQRWYRAAANQGDPFAEASLGIFYNAGKGVPRNLVLAFMWFDRSASHLTGADKESVLEMRDSVGRRLTPEQIAEAPTALGSKKITCG